MAFTATAGYTFLAGEEATSFKLNRLGLNTIANGQSYAFADGTAPAPSIAFSTEPATGFYRIGAASVGLSGAFTASGNLAALNLALGGKLTTAGALTFSGAGTAVTLSGNPTLNDWFNQSVKTTASPTFAGLTVNAFAFTVNGAPTLNDWFNQSVKSTASPVFGGANGSASVTLGGAFTGQKFFYTQNTSGDNQLGVFPSGVGFLGSNTATDLQMYTSGVERLDIMAAGSLRLAAATTIPAANPGGGFYIYCDPADNKLKVRGIAGTITVLALP